MKTGMKCLILLCIGAALTFAGYIRFDQVNRENDRLKVTNIQRQEIQNINGTEYTVED